MERIFALTLLCAFTTIAHAQDVDRPGKGDWCYGPVRAPSVADKEAFVNSIKPAAVHAEQRFGVPASIIAGMSIEESGYGLTRLALKTNNILAFKWPGAKLARGRPKFVLWCQPDRDKGNEYPIFKTREDAISFVAWRLRDGQNYSTITTRYQAALVTGQDHRTAAISWLESIAPHYNWDPKRYVQSVLAKVNDPIRGSGQTDPSTTLWTLAQSVGSTASSSRHRQEVTSDQSESAQPVIRGSPAQSAAETYLHQKLSAARYMSEPPAQCDETPIRNWPGYEGRNVTRCTYTVKSNRKSLSGLVYLLNPTLQNIAQRIGNACGKIARQEDAHCGRTLASWIVNQNGGQFPVAGLVIEAKEAAGGKNGDLDPVYLEFRDGTTVMTADHLNFTDKQLNLNAMEHSTRAPVTETRLYARIANATREQYRLAGGTAPVGSDAKSDRKNLWPSVVRANELKAQDSGIDDLLNGVAMTIVKR